MTNQEKIKNIALDTLHLESKSISNLSSIIDSNFCNIINTLKDCQGKIVLTGIGKSAIIGMKISATLNSTGSKSIFLHLADALHGDMGVISKEDVVICISKSGESDEIISLSNHLLKNKIFLIGISCVKNSSLDKLSKMFLHTKLENRKEPIRIAFIGCGKFVSMFLAQYNHLDKIQIDSIVDLNIDRAKKNCINSGIKSSSIDEINFGNMIGMIFGITNTPKIAITIESKIV